MCVALFAGCSLNPTLQDITGVWVSIGPFPYAKLIVEPGENNILVFAEDVEKAKILEFKSFKTEEYGFRCEVVGLDESGETTKMQGIVINDRIVLSPENDKNTMMWFVREDQLIKYKAIVENKIKEHNKKLNMDPAKNAGPVN